MYRVLDSYGSDHVCWTMREALDWLAYCSPHARIINRWTGRTLRVRIILGA